MVNFGDDVEKKPFLWELGNLGKYDVEIASTLLLNEYYPGTTTAKKKKKKKPYHSQKDLGSKQRQGESISRTIDIRRISPRI